MSSTSGVFKLYSLPFSFFLGTHNIYTPTFIDLDNSFSRSSMATHMTVSRRGPGGKPTLTMSCKTRSLPFLAFQARLPAWCARSLNAPGSTPDQNAAGVIEKQFAALIPAEEGTGYAGVDPKRQRRSAMLLLRFASTVEKAKGKSEVAAPARGCKTGLEEREVDAVEVRSQGIKKWRNAEREALEKIRVEAAERCKRDHMFIQDLQALGLHKDYMRPSAPMFGKVFVTCSLDHLSIYQYHDQFM